MQGPIRPARALPAHQQAVSWSSARQANAQSHFTPARLTVNCVMQGPTRPARSLPAHQQAVSWSSARQANAQSRDFTVNALMLDPFSLLIYDYSGGIKDCSKRVLRSIGSASESLQQDPARIFRAVRHAARCGGSYHPLTFLVESIMLRFVAAVIIFEVPSMMHGPKPVVNILERVLLAFVSLLEAFLAYICKAV